MAHQEAEEALAEEEEYQYTLQLAALKRKCAPQMVDDEELNEMLEDPDASEDLDFEARLKQEEEELEEEEPVPRSNKRRG